MKASASGLELWDKFRGGSDSAFATLYDLYADSLFHYGMKFSKDENFIKDCIQDLFVKIFNNRKNLASTDNPSAYLLHALKNMIIDALTRKRILIYTSDLPFYVEYNAIYENPETDDGERILEQFEAVVNLLSPRQKEVIYLRFQQELSYDQIAQILQINGQSIRNLVHRSIEKIRLQMELATSLIASAISLFAI